MPAATELSNEQIKALLIADLKELEGLYAATKKERDEAVAALEIEKRNSASLERSYKTAENQIDRLNTALDAQARAIALFEKTIAMVEKQRDDAKHEAKRARKIAVISTAITIAQTAARIFGIF